MPEVKSEIPIQKLWDVKHFDKILRYNLDNIGYWGNIYPFHKEWIGRVIKELKRDTYNRIAFGGIIPGTDEESKLCCSVIVKKDPFSPYLEIKNLIVFDDDQDSFTYQKRLIDHIFLYSQQRGYPKLVIEVFNNRKRDKDLIKILLEKDFVISGSQKNKYGFASEVIYMTAEVELLYGLDPYDNTSSAKWILEKYLNSDTLEETNEKAFLIDENKCQHKTSVYSFFYGKQYDSKAVTSKFNRTSNLILIPEYFKKQKKISELCDIIIENPNLKEAFVFDFSDDFESKKSLKENNLLKLSTGNIKPFKDEKYIVFDRYDIESLLEIDKLPKKIRRFSYNNLGGLLLISNPKRFPFDTAKDLIRKKNEVVYIKLGDYGRFLDVNMPIVLAYYNITKQDSSLRIWGYAEINGVEAINLNEFKRNPDINDLDDQKNTYFDSTNALFKSLEEEGAKILWEKEEFEKHNKYNATDRIVAFTISQMIFMNDDISETIEVSEIIDADYPLEETLNDSVDFYLSKKEVQNITEKLPERQDEKHEFSECPATDNDKLDLVFNFLAKNNEHYYSVKEIIENLKWKLENVERIKLKILIRNSKDANSRSVPDNETDFFRINDITMIGISEYGSYKEWKNARTPQ